MFHQKNLGLLFLVVFISACNLPTGSFSTVIARNEETKQSRDIVIQQTLPAVSPTATPSVILSEPERVEGSPSSNLIFYTVQPGDTLSRIAERFGFKTSDLSRANHLANADLIYVGQVLILATPDPLDGPQSPNQVGKQIVVVLSTQRAYAYENGVLQKEFIVATGVAAYPTVTGNFAIYVKLESTRMTGPGYDIPNVPWTMYFYQGYGLHGAPWNNHLGTPGSHGCVNMSVEDADWLFHWASVGTPVLILP